MSPFSVDRVPGVLAAVAYLVEKGVPVLGHLPDPPFGGRARGGALHAWAGGVLGFLLGVLAASLVLRP